MPTYKAGDLVWVHIGGGYGWWPCQVMEPHHTPEQKRAEVLRIKRPGCVLVHCFGDDTFNWFDPRDIADLAAHFNARAAQKHKSPAVKKHFKLAIEQAQEVADVRAGRPPATQHKPVDFTRPETYEHLLAAPAAAAAAAEDDASPDEARLAIRYPAAAAAEDCQAGGAAAAAVGWLQDAARDPAYVCKELSEAAAVTAASASAGAAAAYMRLLWSFIHESAVEQYGPDRLSSRRKSSKKAADSAAAAAAAAAGSNKGQQQQPGDGQTSERTSIKKQQGQKRKISGAAAASGDQQQQPKKHKQQQQGVEVDQTDPRQYDQYILAYGGPIPGAKISKAAQLLAQAAINPASIISPLTSQGAKSIAILLRWREAAFEESKAKEEGDLSKMVKSALLRAGAYPILAPKEAPGSDQQQQQQGGEGAAAAAAASSADVANGIADSADFRVQSDMGDSDASGSSSDSDLDVQQQRQQQHSGRARKPRRKSSRAATTAEGEESALAAIKVVQGASRQDRIRWRQQQLADMGDSDQSHEIGRDQDSSSDWDIGSSKKRKKQRAGAASGSSATAAAAAAKDEESNVTVIEVKQYGDRIPASSQAFMSDMQRWGAERAKEQSLGKVAGHDLTQADAYNIFKLVADRGGHDAACQRRAWGAVTREWYPDLMASAKNVSASVRKWYMRHLLEYERHLSAGCPVVAKSFNLTTGPARPRQRATPLKEKTAAKRIKRESGIDAAATTAAAAVNGGDGSSSSSDSDGSDAEDQGLQDLKPSIPKAIKSDPGAAPAITKETAAAAKAAAAAALADRPRRRLPLPPAAAAAPSPSSSTKPPPSPAAAAGAAPNTSDFNEADRRLVKFTFRQGYKLPPIVTVLNAARKHQHDIDKSNIRVYKHQPIASILYSSATMAGIAADTFRKHGRKMLRVPEDEPFDVEVTWLPERRMDGGRDSSAQANSTNKSQVDSIAAAAAAATGSRAQFSDEDKCLLKLTFRKGYNPPTCATVQQAARRLQRHIDRANVRVYKREPIASILFPDAGTAAAAAERFRQHGKQWLKMPDDEPLEVEVTWLIGKSGEVVRAKPTGATAERAAAYYARSAPPQQQQQQQAQQRLFTGMPPPGGPRPMLSLAPGLAPQQQQQQQQISLPGGIVLVPGAPVGGPGAAAAAAAGRAPILTLSGLGHEPILTLPGLGPGMPQQAPLLMDPRRQQQQQPGLVQYQQGMVQQQQQPGLVVSGPPPLMQQQQQQLHPQQQQQLQMPLQHAGGPWRQQQEMQQQQQQQQAPAPPTMLPIIDLAALANAIGASTLHQQQQPPQQQQPLLLPIQPLQHGYGPSCAGPPQQQQQQPQLSIQQLQLPQMQSLPQQQQQQQQQNPFAWNQAEFQAKLQDLLKGLPPSNGS